MLQKLRQLKNRDEGFTIVEVMIVLAIAGLIILIVFLAIPALQRNSRNTQKRDAASRVLAAVQEFANNKNGTLPIASDSSAVAGLAGMNSADVSVRTSISNTGAPTADNVQIVTSATCSGVTHTPENINNINAADAQDQLTGNGASARGYAAIFIVETNGGNWQLQCQKS